MREEVRRVQQMLEQQVYVTDTALATALYLSMALGKPLLVEGPAGVGKTEIAKAMASALATKLIRLQCYEGLDATTALYEWNYPKQLLYIKLEEASNASEAEKEAAIFGETFLLKRPLLQAITEHERAPVLLIDEIDRSDEEFEAFLLEVLSDFQVTIPEIGTITATHRPFVLLTSNRSRDLSDALRRRCLYHWIDYPSLDKELEIVRARVSGISDSLSAQVTTMMQATRKMNLSKVPGVAETIDWATALVTLKATRLDRDVITDTAGCFLKDEGDINLFKSELESGHVRLPEDASASTDFSY